MKWFLFFFYDPQNQRFSKTVGSDTTYYVYSNGKLLGEYDDSGALLVEYVYLNGRPLAQIVEDTSEVITYFHVDHQGPRGAAERRPRVRGADRGAQPALHRGDAGDGGGGGAELRGGHALPDARRAAAPEL